MFLQGRVIIVWLSWLVGGICGVIILLVIICYCRLMPRYQKSFDEQYLKENYTKDAQAYNNNDNSNYRMKPAEVHVQRHTRPVSYAGGASCGHRPPRDYEPPRPPRERTAHCYVNHVPDAREQGAQYASSSMLDDLESSANMDAMKTRSLPAFLRPKPRPLSTEDDLQQLYAKVSLSKKYKNRMRSEHAAIIALSKSRSQYLDADVDADAVIVYDQRTAL